GTRAPILDLAITFAAFLLLYIPRVPRPVRTLAAGLPLIALGDTLFAVSTFHQYAGMLSWCELAWGLGTALAALSALEPEPAAEARRSSETEGHSLWSWRATLGVVA